MRVLSSLGLITAIGLAMPAAGLAAEQPAVTACLESNAYLDGIETVDLCDPASRVEGLDSRTLSKVHAQLGTAFYFAHRPGIAIPYLDEAIKLDPDADQAFRRRGWSHLMQGENSAAMDDFTEYLALKPDDPDAQFAMAFARREISGDCEAAAHAYERILDEHPDHFITRYNLAGAYGCLDGHRMRQVEQLSRILESDREAVAQVTYSNRRGREDLDFYARVKQDRAELLTGLNRNEEVRADLDWLIKEYPRHPQAFIFRSELLTHSGNPAAALEDAETALALAPYHPDAQFLKVFALERLRRNEDVLQFAGEVLSLGQRSHRTPDFHYWRGIAYKRLGLKNEALQDFNEAMATKEWFTWTMHTQIDQHGYLFGSQRRRRFDDGGPPLDIRAKEFVHAMEACMVDPECMT